jgi:hypothetical protein
VSQKAEKIARYVALIENEGAVLEELFMRLSEGETLVQICKRLKLPRPRVMQWLMSDEERWASYCRAQEISAHALAAEVVQIADAVRAKDDVPAAKLRIDARLKIAAMHAPGRYGETREKGERGGGVTVIVNRAAMPPEPILASLAAGSRASDPARPGGVGGGVGGNGNTIIVETD